MSTGEARWLGVEVSGWPKVLMDVDYQETDDRCVVSVMDGGREVATFEVDKVPVAAAPWLYNIFTVLEGQLLRTRMAGQALA